MSRNTIGSTPTKRQVLAGNLRRLRTEAGLTQSDLGERAGVADGTISRLERGRLDPSATLLTKLAEGLHVGIDELLTTRRVHRPVAPRAAVTRLVALTENLSDGQVDDLVKALRLVLTVGKSVAKS
jgi:transcriptional regulator with XRE-family HTH domain